MAENDNEELNSLKQWWVANGAAIVIGAVLGLVVIGVWQGWGWYQDRQSTAAADTYAQVRQQLANGNVNDKVRGVVDRLKADYAGTPYAADAALNLAAWYIKQEELDKAAEQLDWAMNNAPGDGVRHIARVRKARLLWSRGDTDAALALLDTAHPESFNALYAETAGDIHAEKGDRKAAREAYQRALDSLPPDTPRQPLETKLADNAPIDDAGATSEQETSSAS